MKNDEAARQGGPAQIESPSRSRVPAAGTALQVATVRVLEDLEQARDELGDAAYDTFVDITWRAVTRERIRLGLDEWRQAA